MRKTIASAVSALLLAGGLAFATAAPASATYDNGGGECVPSEAIPGYWEVVPDITHPAEGDEYILVDNPDYQPGTEASTKWWNFAPNEKGPFEGTPLFPEDPNGVWVGPHTEGGPGQELTGVYQQGNGNGSWFYRENTPATPPVGDPKIEVPNPDYKPERVEVVPDIWHDPVDAVTCEEPEEPTTYQPSCTTVTGAATIEGTGVMSVPGGWASTTIAVPFSGTLADIGTVLDIQADPIQYVGLHIRTSEGSISFEEESSYGGKLWSTEAWDGVSAGMGYAAFGTIEEYIHLNGDVVVNGIDLLYTHPEASTTTVTSFTIGCTVYTFVPPVVVPEKPADIVTVDTDEIVDCETDTVTETTTTTTVGHVLVDNVWVEAEPVVIVTSSESPATDTECPPVIPEEPVTPEEPVVPAGGDDGIPTEASVVPLAQTGGVVNPILGGLIAAILALSGVAAWAWDRYHHPRAARVTAE